MSFCVSMFYRLWWRWGHLTWWGRSCVAEGHERGWLKENGPHPVHRPRRLLNLCLQHEIKLAMCAGLWGGNTHSPHWSCCSGHSTLSALDLSFCEESLWVWDMACVCKGRTSRCPSSLGQLAIPVSPDDTPLHYVLPPLPHFLRYCGWTVWGAQLWLWRSKTPWSPSPPFRRGQCCTPIGWPAPCLGCCSGCLPGFSHPPSPAIFRHLTFMISIYEALQI